jgi:hypothetical protein
MAILKAIRPLKVGGEILQAGEMFRTSNVQLLLDRKYARYLTKDEAGIILDDFIRESVSVFDIREKPEMEAEPKPEICYCCHGTDFWVSSNGVKICSQCHPPAASLIKKGGRHESQQNKWEYVRLGNPHT